MIKVNGYDGYVIRLKESKQFLGVFDGHYLWSEHFTKEVILFESKEHARKYWEENKSRTLRDDQEVEICGISMTALYW